MLYPAENTKHSKLKISLLNIYDFYLLNLKKTIYHLYSEHKIIKIKKLIYYTEYNFDSLQICDFMCTFVHVCMYVCVCVCMCVWMCMIRYNNVSCCLI